jgi:hypothetical protein
MSEYFFRAKDDFSAIDEIAMSNKYRKSGGQTDLPLELKHEYPNQNLARSHQRKKKRRRRRKRNR